MDTKPCHGFLGNSVWRLPEMVVKCDEEARPGYYSCKAHEFVEHPTVLNEKIALLANMIRSSSNFIAYSGAGISTSSGIGDYASRSAGTKSKVSELFGKGKGQTYSAQPSLGHRCLTALYFSGHLKWWCQQNHDGLPQKAGMPQAGMNEIHGSWWDPSNPVVPMSGNLREDLLEELCTWEQRADLCLAVGTSLSGMNADRLVQSCGERAALRLQKQNQIAENGYPVSHQPQLSGTTAVGGSVIVGFQCTALDHLASLRIYAPIDKVMYLLAQEMQLDLDHCIAARACAVDEMLVRACPEQPDVFLVQGYDPVSGLQCKLPARCDSQDGSGTGTGSAAVGGSANEHFLLDLREGSKVRIMSGPRAGSLGEVMGRRADGSWDLLFQVPAELTRRPPPPPQSASTSTSSRGGGGKTVGQLATLPWRCPLGKWMVVDVLEGMASHLVIMNA